MGVLFKNLALAIYVIAGLWGFFISLGIVVDNLGFIGGAIAFFLFPVTLIFAPWYEALTNSNWFPLILIYGGAIGASILYAIGSAFKGD